MNVTGGSGISETGRTLKGLNETMVSQRKGRLDLRNDKELVLSGREGSLEIGTTRETTLTKRESL